MPVIGWYTYVYQLRMIGEKELYIIQLVLQFLFDLFLFPVTLIALIYILFTIHYVFSSTCSNIYNQVNGSLKR